MASEARSAWVELVAASKEYLKLKTELPKPPAPKPAAAAAVVAPVKKPAAAESSKPASSKTRTDPSAVVLPVDNKRVKSILKPAAASSTVMVATPPPKPISIAAKPPAMNASKLILATRFHPKFQSLYIDGLEKLEEVPSREEWEGDSLHVLAVDCEMVQTVDNDMALARVSVLELRKDWRNTPKMVLDELVMPCSSIDFIVDPRTQITGLVASQLATIGLSISQVRKRFTALLEPHTIIVGHALEHDLLAMEIRYNRVIDTALLFDVEGSDRLTHSLQFLYNGIVGDGEEENNNNGRARRGGTHDSVEDALMAFKIVQSVLCNASLYQHQFPIALPREEAGWKRRLATQRGAMARLLSDRIHANNIGIRARLEAIKNE